MELNGILCNFYEMGENQLKSREIFNLKNNFSKPKFLLEFFMITSILILCFNNAYDHLLHERMVKIERI